MNSLQKLYETVSARKDAQTEGSYTCYLFGQVIIAEKNGDNSETVLEISDLLYHLTVLMVQQGITLEQVEAELKKRSGKQGNLKTFHQVDKNT